MARSEAVRPKISVIAVHGNGGGAFRFRPIIPFLPEWINFRPITFPGFGGKWLDPSLQSVNDYADWLHQRILAAPEPRVLLGTGIGGTFAMDVAVRFSADIDALILHAPVGTRLDTRWFPRLMQLPLMTELGRRLLSAKLFRPISQRLLFRSPISQKELDAFYAGYENCAAFGQMFAIITPEWFAGLEPSPTPTALLWGERERVLTVDQIDDYKQIFPNHTVRTVPAWDHFPTLEQPAAFVQVMCELIDELLER